MSNIIVRALEFATKAHEGQKRKYTGEPYIMHPMAVALTVSSVLIDANNIASCAALLHDTVEDCGVTFEEIKRQFGDEVGDLVYWLTDVSKPEDGNRAQRKEIDRMHIAKAPRVAKVIKLADLIDNSKSIVERDPEFAKVYMREKALLLQVLADANNQLFAIADKIVGDYFAKHGEM